MSEVILMWDGIRRKGKPRSNAERKKRHKAKYGTTKLPPRGSGLKSDSGFFGHTKCQRLF